MFRKPVTFALLSAILIGSATAFAQTPSSTKVNVYHLTADGKVASLYGVLEGDKLVLAGGSHIMRTTGVTFDAKTKQLVSKYTMYDTRGSVDAKYWATDSGGEVRMAQKDIVFSADGKTPLYVDMEIQRLWRMVGNDTMPDVMTPMRVRGFKQPK